VTFEQRVVAAWYTPRLTAVTALLWPVSLLFGGLAAIRRALYRAGVLKAQHLPVPVVVVGNITMGGSGKTPFVIALAEALRLHGWHPGLVSRGHGGSARGPRAVLAGEAGLMAPPLPQGKRKGRSITRCEAIDRRW